MATVRPGIHTPHSMTIYIPKTHKKAETVNRKPHAGHRVVSHIKGGHHQHQLHIGHQPRRRRQASLEKSELGAV